MKHFDHIVVGSGISGMTAALLLAMNRRRVLLLERAPHMGGSLSRFYRAGVPFDTGFHFTGGLSDGGLLQRMMRVLGIDEAIQPVFLSPERAHRFVFESENRTVDLPCGIAGWRRQLKEEFPGETAAVDRYFDLVEKVRAGTASMDLRRLGEPSAPLDEDYTSLKTVIDGLTDNRLLKGVFCGLGMCYGVKPSEISFANHSRVCYDLYQSTARIRNGGDAVVMAFADRFNAMGVEVLCGRHIVRCGTVTDDRAASVILDDGTEVAAESVILTIHPKDILKILPESTTSTAFRQRVAAFEPAAGFFTAYGVMVGAAPPPEFETTIVSLFPSTDFDQLLDSAYTGEPALVLVGSTEPTHCGLQPVLTTFEPSFPEHVASWTGSFHGKRPVAYRNYKRARTAAILRHLGRYRPVYADHVKVLDAASLLTFRDYLFSPDGSAYGIKQKVGQFNLIGRLPVRNFFAAGQNALLPGLAGAMMSSFVVIRAVLGKDEFSRFICDRL